MKAELFNEMMAGFPELIKYRKGESSKARVSRIAITPKQLKPSEIRKIRRRLRISQPMFAQYLGTTVSAVRSWEQGKRRPQRTALRLLRIARDNPAALLQGVA